METTNSVNPRFWRLLRVTTCMFTLLGVSACGSAPSDSKLDPSDREHEGSGDEGAEPALLPIPENSLGIVGSYKASPEAQSEDNGVASAVSQACPVNDPDCNNPCDARCQCLEDGGVWVNNTCTFPPTFIISAIDTTTGEDGSTGKVTVKLGVQPSASVSLSFMLNDASEAQLSVGQLTFSQSNWSTAQTITLTGLDDSLVDGTVSYQLHFLDVNSTDNRFDRRTTKSVPSPLTFTNSDNEPGIVLVNKSSDPAEYGSRSTLRLKLSKAPTSNVTLALSSTDTTEATLTTTALTFTPTNWNTLQWTQVVGVDDELVDGDPAYSVRAAAASSDATFNGKVLNVPFTTYDDDHDIRAASAATGPFTCQKSGSTVSWKYTNDSVQNRSLTDGNDDAYVELKVLNVNLRSTYTRTFTDAEIAEDYGAHGEAMHKVVDVTHGQLVPVRTSVEVPRHWSRHSFAACETYFTLAQCGGANAVVFSDYATLGAELTNLGFDPANYDVVQVHMPFANGLVDGERYFGYAFSMLPTSAGPFPWYEGRLTMYVRQPGEAQHRSSVSVHELSHQLEWALERAGSWQMHNPDNAFWGSTFPTRADESVHWRESSDAALRGIYWTQRGKWNLMPTASVLPKGALRTRVGTHKIVGSCPTPTEYLERRSLR